MFKLFHTIHKTPGYLSDPTSVSVCSFCSRKVTFPVPGGAKPTPVFHLCRDSVLSLEYPGHVCLLNIYHKDHLLGEVSHDNQIKQQRSPSRHSLTHGVVLLFQSPYHYLRHLHSYILMVDPPNMNSIRPRFWNDHHDFLSNMNSSWHIERAQNNY